MPTVTGDSPSAAAAAVTKVGLVPKKQGDGDPFAFLLPISYQVCSESPSAGTKVAPGTTVTLHIAKVCF